MAYHRTSLYDEAKHLIRFSFQSADESESDSRYYFQQPDTRCFLQGGVDDIKTENEQQWNRDTLKKNKNRACFSGFQAKKQPKRIKNAPFSAIFDVECC
ncbi:MAG: hypothetical protein IKH88_14805 [Prevotella sp.]|nr:hypothetical protein [Prevotella sp.]